MRRAFLPPEAAVAAGALAAGFLGMPDRLLCSAGKPSRKATDFEQPLRPHPHWHTGVSYINICGTLYYLCTIRTATAG